MSSLLLIDGNSLIFRAYYGSAYNQDNIMRTKSGIATNALLTGNRMITGLIDKFKPSHILIALDTGKKTFRHKKFQTYKAHRASAPDDLKSQFPLFKEMISLMGIAFLEIEDYEADDIIASAASKIPVDQIIVASSDKDLLQLVNEKTAITKLGSQGNDELILITNFKEIYGCEPSQIPDLKGIMGDTSDGLPGVMGVGEVGAIKLLAQYQTLDEIYANIDSIKGSTREKLIHDKDSAFLCRDLATLVTNLEIPFQLQELEVNHNVSQQLLDFFIRYELFTLVKKHEKYLLKGDFDNIKL